MGRTDRMPFRRSKTPIFEALASRYSTRNGWVSDTEEQWALGAFMRGFTYLLVLQDVETPPPVPPPIQHRIPRGFDPSVWDAIDATPNEHHPDL